MDDSSHKLTIKADPLLFIRVSDSKMGQNNIALLCKNRATQSLRIRATPISTRVLSWYSIAEEAENPKRPEVGFEEPKQSFIGRLFPKR